MAVMAAYPFLREANFLHKVAHIRAVTAGIAAAAAVDEQPLGTSRLIDLPRSASMLYQVSGVVPHSRQALCRFRRTERHDKKASICSMGPVHQAVVPKGGTEAIKLLTLTVCADVHGKSLPEETGVVAARGRWVGATTSPGQSSRPWIRWMLNALRAR